MKNPLRKRLLREIRGDMGKYLVIFLMLIVFIGFVSGYIVANSSMLAAYHEGFTKYNVENGHFTTTNKMNPAQKKAAENMGITVYDQFCVNDKLENGTTLRIYADRTEVNLPCVMKGRLPEAVDEIALDRMYAENNELNIGDTIGDGSRTWTVTGLIALPDYSCLFENNNDSMFDSLKFGVALVSGESFAQFAEDQYSYTYVWKYKKEPATETEENEVANDIMDQL